MNNPILQYVNTGKKLNLRIEKLLSALYLSNFSGTVTVINGNEEYKVVVVEKLAFFDRSVITLSTLDDKALFKLDSAVPEDIKKKSKEYNLLEFIFKIIENVDRHQILSLLKPYATDHFSINPEAGKLMFLYAELEPFIGTPRIEIFANLKKNYRTIYFLLTTRFAGIIKSTEAERTTIQEKVNRTSMFDESDKDESENKDVFKNSEMSYSQKLSEYLSANEKYRDVFSLFGLAYGFEEKELHKSYVQIVQKIHPDRLHDVTPALMEKAEKMLKTVSENYELLKNPEDSKSIFELMKKYGPIRTRTDYVRLKEYDEVLFKGISLQRLGEFEAASIIFNELFINTLNPVPLEKKIFSLWSLHSKWDEAKKLEKYPELKHDILTLLKLKNPDFEIFFILAEIYEYLKMIPDCMKTLVLILKHDPESLRAKGMKKRLMYYEAMDKKEKK
jgi:tetratricopeptide (TPR) repeat protein